MKILFAHNFYRIPGGEDSVVQNEVQLLRNNKHDVQTFYVDSKSFFETAGIGEKLNVALKLSFSEKIYQQFKDQIKSFQPDIIHIHNTFPLITSAPLYAAKQSGRPAVITLHNYRGACANALLLRNEKPCEKCLTGSPLWGLIHRCYRDSGIATLPITLSILKQGKMNASAELAEKFIVLSDFSKQKFVEMGVSRNKLEVIPNFSEDPGTPPAWSSRKPFCIYAGRLSTEKGILDLLRHWKEDFLPLHIYGDGPLMEKASEISGKNVFFHGLVSKEKISSAMREAKLLIIPSICYENFPMTLAEAFSHGLPVLANKIGSLGTLIENNVNGILYESSEHAPFDAINLRLKNHDDDSYFESISKKCRNTYENNLSPGQHLRKLESLYSSLSGSES